MTSSCVKKNTQTIHWYPRCNWVGLTAVVFLLHCTHITNTVAYCISLFWSHLARCFNAMNNTVYLTTFLRHSVCVMNNRYNSLIVYYRKVLFCAVPCILSDSTPGWRHISVTASHFTGHLALGQKLIQTKHQRNVLLALFATHWLNVDLEQDRETERVSAPWGHHKWFSIHYSDVIMRMVPSQITSCLFSDNLSRCVLNTFRSTQTGPRCFEMHFPEWEHQTFKYNFIELHVHMYVPTCLIYNK